jgi:hypothetical protein
VSGKLRTAGECNKPEKQAARHSAKKTMTTHDLKNKIVLPWEKEKFNSWSTELNRYFYSKGLIRNA